LVGALLVLLGITVSGCRVPSRPDAALVHVVILHTNDVHGQVLPAAAPEAGAPAVGGLARLAACIRELRATEPDLVVVDAGDWSQGTPEGALDSGSPFLEALDAVGYDAMCIGNHDLDHGIATLVGQLSRTGLPAILSNVRELDGSRVAWAQPWRIVEVRGVRIALVGLLTTATPEITHPDALGLRFEDPALAWSRAREELAGAADVLIPIAHLGLSEARALARAHPDIELLISGHSHDALPEGLREGSTLIAQAGSKAAFVGRVDLWISDHGVVEVRAQLLPLTEDPKPEQRVPEVEAACEHLEQRSSERLAQRVGILAAPATRLKTLGSSSAGNWICDAMLRRTGADVALHNKGGARSDLAPGPLTRRDIYQFLPFENELVVMTLSGRELEACVRRAVEVTLHKGLDYAGMTVFVRRESEEVVRLARIEIGGLPLECEREYRVATSSYLAGGGSGLVELEHGANQRTIPVQLRDLMVEELVAGYATPSEEQRVIVIEEP
jgi:2',3'-cyclic-nucleotide 2'-phosphodiesterase (5'-nucleotidase family)